MGALVLVFTFLIGCSATAKTPPSLHHLTPHGTYHSKFEKLDLDMVLASRRLVNNYVACLVGERTCTAEGLELKVILPDALATNCEKCTPKQKEGVKKTVRTLETKYPDQWKLLKKKWNVEKLKEVV